jgi:predicted ATPase
MIKRIKVQNFLSLKDVELDLRERNVFVGANMSGKSNLIECLKFLQEAVVRNKPGTMALQLAFANRGGFSDIPWQGHAENSIQIELTAALPKPESKRTNTYNYSISLRRNAYEQLEVESEILTLDRDGKREILLENAGGKLKLIRNGSLSEQSQQHTLGLALELWGGDKPSASAIFRDFVIGWRFYRLVPALMRDRNQLRREQCLSEHGENLSVWLLALQNYRREFEILRQVAQDTLPDLESILFQAVESRQSPPSSPGQQPQAMEPAGISIAASERYHPRPINIMRMSDGELAFIALLSLILAPKELRPSLLCIEEPENYLHPHLLQVLVELLNQSSIESDATQIIATTHSPLLVDRLKLDELIVTEKEAGATKFNRASNKKHLKEILSRKELGLGDLWYSGALSSS